MDVKAEIDLKKKKNFNTQNFMKSWQCIFTRDSFNF